MDGMTKNIGKDKIYMFAIQLLDQIFAFFYGFLDLCRQKNEPWQDL